VDDGVKLEPKIKTYN